MTTDPHVENHEHADVLESLAKHRSLLRQTVDGLTDEQAAQRPTTSELCLGGIIKHVTQVEVNWANFIVQGPISRGPEDGVAAQAASFRMTPGETLVQLLDRYQEVAGRTDDLLGSIASLDASQPLPEAPWFEPGGRWTVRRVILHIIAETAQHAGHADIIRESIDGAKTMG